MNDNNLSKILKLEELAKKVLLLKNENRQRRPIIIEFCGSPKSGKTSCINSLNIFLKRNGFRTKILTERANVCPIPSKKDPLFNIWTLCSSMAELVECLAIGVSEIDVIILDRGIFDSMCWFEWLNKKNYLNITDFDPIMRFLSLDIWRRFIDLIYIFQVPPETSLRREYSVLLTRKSGSIMNSDTLIEFNNSIDAVFNNRSSIFRKVERIDTSMHKQNEVSEEVTSDILEILKDMLIEKIGYFAFDKSQLGLEYGIYDFSLIEQEKIEFNARDIVEESDNLQPIPIAVFTSEKRDRVLVIKKQPESLGFDSPEKDKLLLYTGGHIRIEDNTRGDNEPILNLMKKTLNREISEELGISIYPDEKVKPFLIFTPDHQRSKRHIAVCFVFEIDFDKMNFKLDEREIIQQRGLSESGQTIAVKSLGNRGENIESWSRLILEKIFDISQRQDVQLVFREL